MTVVQSVAGLMATDTQWSTWRTQYGGHPGGGAISLYDKRIVDYSTIYRSQPNVRLCVRFYGRNIASLSLKAYRRVSDTERQPLEATHPLRKWLGSPTPAAPKPPSFHRWARALVEDFMIFDNFYSLMARNTVTDTFNAFRLPPQITVPVGPSFVGPDHYELRGNREIKSYAPADVYHLFGHNPFNPSVGVSTLEAIRSLLAEEESVSEWREQYWRNAARQSGVLKRPVDVPKWTDTARARFLADWRQWESTNARAGGTPILEEGMDFEPSGFSPKDSEYLGARKLSREEAAAQFFILPAFVGILENANFANMREQHVSLYVDTLGPVCSFIEDEMVIQVLPQFPDTDDVYVEFNLDEKLRGNFEQQVAALSASVGAPWMTRNEARALLNKPPIDGGDDLVTPLNVLVGRTPPGPTAEPSTDAPASGGAPDTAPTEGDSGQAARRKLHHGHGAKTGMAPALLGWRAKHLEVMGDFFLRQSASVRSKLGARQPLEEAFDAGRWDQELADDLLAVAHSMTTEIGADEAAHFGAEFDLGRAEPWLATNARIAAERINASTLAAIQARITGAASRAKTVPGEVPALTLADLTDEGDGENEGDGEDPFAPAVVSDASDVFDLALAVRSVQIATSRTTEVGSFARHEGATQAGATQKTWNVNADPSRHADLDGETVPCGETFSNGALWPGDSEALPEDQTAGCLCSLTFSQ